MASISSSHKCSWYMICVHILLLVSKTTPLNLDSKVQGCSLLGMDLHSCLVPITKQTPFTVGSCCETLNRVLEAGYFCLCTLFGSSGYPIFSAELQLSFSNCYISLPPLSHCHVSSEPQPVALAPPATSMPLPNNEPPRQQADPLMPVLDPPDDQSGGEGFVPLPPKVNEMPVGENGNSSMVGSVDPIPNSSPLPLIGIPERWGYAKSDGGNVKEFSRNLMMILVGFWLYCMKSVN